MPNKSIGLDSAIAIGPKKDTLLLDVYIQDAESSSFEVEHDTSIGTPVLSGPTHTEGLAQEVPYTISNLDPDVIEVFAGENVFGINDIHSFVNNGDGTGAILVDFDPLVVPRRLSIVVKDDVDNESNESNVIAVFDLESHSLNTELTLVPQRMVWTDTCESLIDRIPVTDFIQKSQFNVPFSFNPIKFELRAVTPGIPVRIEVVREGQKGDQAEQLTVVPASRVHVVDIVLGKGRNTIMATDGERETVIFVVAAHYAAIHCAYAREIFNFSQNIIEEQERAIDSPISTRLAEPYIHFTEDLPDIRSLQVLATKLGVKTLVNDTKKEKGVRDFLAALTLSTPVFHEQQNEMEKIEPAIYPLHTAAEDFAGVEAHVWIQNTCVANWLAFLRYLDNLDVFRVVSVSESEVVFVDDNDNTVAHRFDFEDPECSILTRIEQELCFVNVTVSVAMAGTLHISICAAQYPFDLKADKDGNYPVTALEDEDGEGGLDPGFDGLDGLYIVGRFDKGVELDSRGAQPAADSDFDTCVFDSFIVYPHTLASADVETTDLQFDIGMTGEYTNQRPASTLMDAIIAAPRNHGINLDAPIAEGMSLTSAFGAGIAGLESKDIHLNTYIANVNSRMINMDVNIVDE